MQKILNRTWHCGTMFSHLAVEGYLIPGTVFSHSDAKGLNWLLDVKLVL